MKSPIIVALDFECKSEAISLVTELGSSADFYKVGLQLLTEQGPDVVRDLINMEKSVFLDLKLHEIPNSVAGGVCAAGKLGASMVTVHASAGSAVLSAAVKAAAPFPNLKVLAVTVITSLTDDDLPEIGFPPSVRDQVLRLAKLASAAGCHGIVASAHEAAYLRQELAAEALIVTPGIQFPESTSNDQSRVATPRIASASGATHVVIGRAITRAPQPREAFAMATSLFNAGKLHT